jgi:hypothetical protein
MSEQFVINDITLRVNPTDITTVQKRNVATSEFMRDDSSYAYKSKFAHTAFNVIMTFDVTNSEELDNLIRLCTELDGYPFAFIRSARMENHLSHTFRGSNDYHIYGVEEYELSQHSETSGVVYLRLNLLFFNYIPFAKSFAFTGLKEIDIKSTFSANSQINKGKSSTEYVPAITDTLGEEWSTDEQRRGFIKKETVLSLFKRLFDKEYVQRKSKVLAFGSAEKPLSFLSMAPPTISSSKPYGYDDLKARGLAEDYEVTTTAGLTTTKIKNSDIPAKTTIYTIWNHVVNDDGTRMNFNSGDRSMVRITITKRNNFATHHLSGYNHPILQYMGKGSSTHSVDFELASGLDSQSIEGESPVSYLKHVFNTIDTNFTKFRGMDSFNVARIDAFLLSLIPAYGYVLDQENIYASASDQGKEVYSYVLQESDTRNLMDRSRYNDAGNKETDFTIEVMADIIKSVLRDVINIGPVEGPSILDITASYINAGVASIITPPFASDDEYEEVNDALLALNESLIQSYETILLKEDPNYNVQEYGRREHNILSKYRADTDSNNLSNIVSILDRRLNKSGTFEDKELLIIDREVQSAFRAIIQMRSRGNPYTAAAQQYVDLIKNNYESIVQDFSDEGYSDLRLDERLGISSGSLLKWDIEDARTLGPFFFLKQEKYTSAKNMKAIYDAAARISNESINDAINKQMEAGATGDLTAQAIIAITPELSKEGSGGEVTEEMLENINRSSNTTGKLQLPNDEEDVFSTFKNSNIDPFNERDQALYQTARMAQQFEAGMDQAWPTIKAFIVEGDESSPLNKVRLRKHNYYEVKGLINCEVITNNDESPVDYLVMDLANPGNTYTDGHVMHSINKSIKDQDLLGTIGENQFALNKLTLRPGNRLHIKAGYNNDINKLETIFNGVITDIEPHDSGETKLRVNAESFGRELIQFRHGDDPGDDLFWLSATTKKIVSHCLYYPEIEHFGTFKFGALAGEDPEAKEVYTTSAFGWVKTRLFTNIYTNDVIQDVFKSEDKDIGFNVDLTNIFSFTQQVAYDFPIYKATPWESLKEMEFRHPGTLSKPVIYGDRQSYFFGIKEQLYVHRDLAGELMMESTVIGSIFGTGGGWDDDYQDSDSLYSSLRFLRFKPVCDFHILSSDHNIISNGLKVTDNFNSVVNLQYYGDQSDIKDGDFENYEMKIDDNLIPSEHRRGDFQALGMHGKFMAYKYGSVYLRREMEKMYDGTIVTIGNPLMKAGDYASMHDDLRMLKGIVKIRECVHSFSIDNGYTCRLTPGLYVESSQFNYSQLFSKLFLTAERAMAVSKFEMQVSLQSSRATIKLNFVQGQFANGEKESGIIVDDLEVAGAALASNGALGASGYMIYRGAVNSTADNLLNSTVKHISGGLRQLQSKVDTTLLLNGVDKITGAVGGSTPVQFLSDKLPKSAALTKSIGLTARTGLAFGSRAIGVAFGLSPVGWVASLVAALASAKYDEVNMTRQPVRFYPLQLNGVQYIGGIGGYKDNGYFESIASEIEKTVDDFGYLLGVANSVK